MRSFYGIPVHCVVPSFVNGLSNSVLMFFDTRLKTALFRGMVDMHLQFGTFSLVESQRCVALLLPQRATQSKFG